MAKAVLGLFLAILALSGCAAAKKPSPIDSGNSSSGVSSAAQAEPPGESAASLPESEPELKKEPLPEPEEFGGVHPYLGELTAVIAEELLSPEMSEFEKSKAAFDYMLLHTDIGEPVLSDLWRIHGGREEAIPFLEQRALSPLRFGIGMCEDYAAALTLLLREMGLQALYVPGLTYSAEGHLVDHAWTMVQIDGIWYHLDSQLEDSISRHGMIRYKYFLRGDATLSSSHRWGQNLIDSGLLREEQNEEIREDFPAPACPQDYPAPEPLPLPESPAQDPRALRREAAVEIAAWEKEHGALPPMKLDSVPPVFGLEGYGPADEG